MNDMTVVDILKATREKISDPRHWTQGFFALDRKGFPTPALSEDAVSWCLEGALLNACTENYSKAWNVIVEIAGDIPTRFNDSHTHADVIALLDKAIAECERGSHASTAF